MAPGDSLNRTSVGLKLPRAAWVPARLSTPQSNQRGIETLQERLAEQVSAHASIEPAWD